jgi:hypothetical protein
MKSAVNRGLPNAIDLLKLAFEHDRVAKQSTCPADQQLFQRAADIFAVLASLAIRSRAFRCGLG